MVSVAVIKNMQEVSPELHKEIISFNFISFFAKIEFIMIRVNSLDFFLFLIPPSSNWYVKYIELPHNPTMLCGKVC